MTDAAVDYPLLAGAQLLAIAAAVALGLVACAPALRGRGTRVLVAGAALLVVTETITGLALLEEQAAVRGVLRTLALAACAGGLWLGALGVGERTAADAPRPASTGSDEVRAALHVPLLAAVTVSLSVPRAIAVATGVAGTAAALAAWRYPPVDRGSGRRGDVAGRAALTAGLLLWGWSSVATGLGSVTLRALGALGLLVCIAVLARASLLGKVLLVTAAAAVGTAVVGVVAVGMVLSASGERQQARTAEAVGVAELAQVEEFESSAVQLAQVVPFCLDNPAGCSTLLSVFRAETATFAGQVTAAGEVVRIGGSQEQDLLLQGLARQEGGLVDDVLAGEVPVVGSTRTVLPSSAGPRLALVAAAPVRQGDAVVGVAVYGTVLTAGPLRQEVADEYDVSVLVGRAVLASTVEDEARREAIAAAADEVAAGGIGDGLTVPPSDDRPTLRLLPVRDAVDGQVAVLAVSGPEGGLRDELGALRALFVSALVVSLLVALGAAALGQRIAQPVRHLTTVARRIRRGDLSVRAGVHGSDEVAVLGRTFDTMTASLASSRADLVRAAEQESELRARLEAVLGSLDDGVVALDAQGAVASANPAALRLVGRTEDDVVSRPVEEVVVLADREGDAVPTANGVVRERETVLVRPDGREVPVEVAAAPLRNAAGRTTGQVLVLRDRTRERQVERMKTEFLSNVSHELRTPLTPILGYGEMLRARPAAGEDAVVQWSGEVVRGARRLTRVVDLLVDVAALEAGNLRADPRPVDTEDLLRARAQVWQSRTPERTTDLTVDVPADVPAACVDPRWAAKALDELIDNALKYSEPGDPVTLLARSAEGRVRLLVRDGGAGMDDDAAAAAFETFRQGDGSATRSVGGLGLGLGFVRRLAEESGWRLQLRSEPGVGTVVAVEVPAGPVVGEQPRRSTRRRRAARVDGAQPRTGRGRRGRPARAPQA